jgi:hypothetical protein
MCLAYLVMVEGRCSTCGGYELTRLDPAEIAVQTQSSRS